ncbi:MAG: ABC transporter permease, partial [Streptococcaceae bacterium]|nr:ABC transporter permease [Streptococcaceae bacterium]
MMVQTLTLVVSLTLLYSTPLIFTSLGGTFSERSGIVNVGLEGIMVMGAFASVLFNQEFGANFGSAAPWLSLLFGGVVGLIFALLHAVATVSLRADHIISGTVINLMAPALSIFIVRLMYGSGQVNNITGFSYTNIPILDQIPVIGPMFFGNIMLVSYLAIVLSVVCWFVIFKTRFGLRLRAVGEHPQAADTLGINVYKMRYAGVLLSGFFGGLGGAVFTQTISGQYRIGTIAGQGFMAMAAMIFGKWSPLGAMGASIFFGLAQILPLISRNIPFLANVPNVWLQT